MFRKKVFLQCRLERNQTAWQLYQKFMEHFSVKEEKCPTCNSKGRCIKHAWYMRNLIDYTKEGVQYNKIRVIRVRCLVCNHTHAVLPDSIIPYMTYSLPFLLCLFSEKFFFSKTVAKICSEFQITVSMFYRWLYLYEEHRKISTVSLYISKESPEHFLRYLYGQKNLSDVLGQFYRFNRFSFLQNHRDYLCRFP